MSDTIVVTRHSALVEYLREIGLIGPETPVLPHAGAEEVRGKHVIGVLPLHLACLTDRITVVPIDVGRDVNIRDVELTLEQVRQYARPPETYYVRTEEDHEIEHARALRAGHEWGDSTYGLSGGRANDPMLKEA